MQRRNDWFDFAAQSLDGDASSERGVLSRDKDDARVHGI